MDKGYKVIRVITAAPVPALVMTGLAAGNCERMALVLLTFAFSG